MDQVIFRDLYPFEGHRMQLGGFNLHYLDEGPRDGGTGGPLVMVHGNPTWSFYFRELVKAFRTNHRVVVPDHIGCGLSDKPSDKQYEYRLKQRVDDLEALLDRLQLKENLTLVMHDWGGMIGMAFASRYPERIRRLVLLNTAAFHLPASKALPLSLRLCRDSKLGAFLVRGLNAFARTASFVGTSEKALPGVVRDAYCAPYDSWANRIATLRFVQDIPLAPGDPSYALVSEVEKGLTRFADRPIQIFWGEKDFVFDRHFLVEWKKYFPKAEVHSFPRAGHYVLEDASDRIIPAMREFLEANRL